MAGGKKVLEIDPEMTLLFGELASPLESEEIEWRIDGRPQPDGTARFVPYARANAVRKRLDSVVPGRWSLELKELPLVSVVTGPSDEPFAFKATIRIAFPHAPSREPIEREDVGSGRDYKSASTDAFKRAAVRFGIGHELYDMEALMVPVNGQKPACDPKAWYDYVFNGGEKPKLTGATGAATAYAAAAEEVKQEVKKIVAKPATPQQIAAAMALAHASDPYAHGLPSQGDSMIPKALVDQDDDLPFEGAPACPKCGGEMWDNRVGKRNPRAPDFKCKRAREGCEGVIWPPRGS